VLESGLKVDTSDIAGMAEIVIRLLSDLAEWERVVRAQAAEIDAYPRRPDDDRLHRRLAPGGGRIRGRRWGYPRVLNGSAG
jgi:hypothetical protein